MFVDITMRIFLFILFFPISFMTLEDICSHDNRHFYFLYFFNFFFRVLARNIQLFISIIPMKMLSQIFAIGIY